MAGTHPPPELQHLSQKELMLREYLYNPWDAELVADRNITRDLVAEFNTSSHRDMGKRSEILKKLFSPESHVPFIEPNFRCDYGFNITWGENCFMNFDSCILDVAAVKIGKNFMAGPAVHIYTATHPVDPVPRRDREFAKAVTIGDDVWIGGQSTICPGVKIGNGVTIGAGSVVTKDVPDFVVVAGNPARVIRTLEKPADYS